MSDLFVDNIKHQSSQGSGTITLGASGETVDLSTASNKLAPNVGQLRFITTTTSSTNLPATDTFYKTTWNNEKVDNFDEFSPTDYRFTASEAGTYLFNVGYGFYISNERDQGQIRFYKNGSGASNASAYTNSLGSNDGLMFFTQTYITDLSVNDYIEIYAKYRNNSYSNRKFNKDGTTGEAFWAGYRIA